MSLSRPDEPVRAWLMALASRELDVGDLLNQLVARLEEAGVDVARASLSVRTLHPEVFVENALFTREDGVVVRPQPNTLATDPSYTESPVAAIHRGVDEIRVRLDTEGSRSRYAVCRDLAASGHTDYAIFALPGRANLRSFISFATRLPGGYDEASLSLLRALVPALSLRVELASQRLALASLLRTYLGANAARRVLDGSFRRGGGEPIHAVVFTCDLRGFTTLVDREPIERVLTTLDDYFECVADPIADEGGEVLKFIGDAVLAIFVPEAGDVADACARALLATERAFVSLAALNAARGERGETPLAFGVALHVGLVTYGNIGSTDRLDFTVIGRAVNEATRVESLSKTLGEPLLMTEEFAKASGRGDLESLGHHALRGVASDKELFTLRSAEPR